MSLAYDPATKAISALDTTDIELVEEVDALNRLVKDLVSTKSEVPESPEPSKTLAPLIKKLATSGVESMKAQKFPDAVKQFTLAIDMASRRTRWEAFGVQLQEMTNLLQARCDAYMMSGKYPEAHADADVILQLQVNSPENFLRRALPAMHMGKFEDAKVDIEKGLSLFPNEQKLVHHYMAVKAMIAEENGDVQIKQ